MAAAALVWLAATAIGRPAWAQAAQAADQTEDSSQAQSDSPSVSVESAPASVASRQAEPVEQAGGSVFVELRSDDPAVRIERITQYGTGPRVTVCQAPCRRWLARRDLYVIGGEGVRPTSRFVLPDDRDQLTLDVRAGRTSTQTLGALLAGGGVVVCYVGFLYWDVNFLSSFGGATHSLTPGYVMMGGGLAAAVLGLVIVLTTETQVSSSTGNTFSLIPEPGSRPRRHSRFAITARGLEF